MSKKVRVIVSALVAVVLLVVAGTVTVMAAGDNQTAAPPKTVQSRLAEKLGITEDRLANANKAVQAEIRDEALSRNLDKAVEKGRITADDATKIKAWWQARPAAVDKLFPGALGAPFMNGAKMGVPFSDNRTAFSAPNQRGRRMGFGMRGGMPKPPPPAK